MGLTGHDERLGSDGGNVNGSNVRLYTTGFRSLSSVVVLEKRRDIEHVSFAFKIAMASTLLFITHSSLKLHLDSPYITQLGLLPPTSRGEECEIPPGCDLERSKMTERCDQFR